VDALVGAVPIGSDVVRQTVEEVVRSRGGAGILATVGLALSGVGVFSAVRAGINHAWGVVRSAPFLTRRYQDLAMFVGIVALAFLLLLGANPFTGLLDIQEIEGVWGFRAPPIWWTTVAEAIAFAATSGALFLLYRYLPNTAVSWGELWPGVLAGSAIIEGTRLAFGGLIGLVNNFNLVFGSLGALVAVLAWAYFSAIGLLFGAQVCAAYGRRHQEEWRLHVHVEHEPGHSAAVRSLTLVRAFVRRLNALRDRPH
jgi:membrane protein